MGIKGERKRGGKKQGGKKQGGKKQGGKKQGVKKRGNSTGGGGGAEQTTTGPTLDQHWTREGVGCLFDKMPQNKNKNKAPGIELYWFYCFIQVTFFTTFLLPANKQ